MFGSLTHVYVRLSNIGREPWRFTMRSRIRFAYAIVLSTTLVCVSTLAVSQPSTQKLFHNCAPNTARCPDATAACFEPNPGEPCEYCSNPATSWECSPGFDICFESLNINANSCGSRMSGVCGPAGCEGSPSGSNCPRYSCIDLFPSAR